MSERSERCRVLVIGGGFAGCLTGTIAARLGYDTVVLERQRHPRFAIGESLTPLANQLLRHFARRYDLPQLAALSRAGSWRRLLPQVMGGTKRGFSYFHHHPGKSFSTDSRHTNELLVAASRRDEVADTQWLRADVDAWFANLARSAGVQVVEQVEIEQAGRTGTLWEIVYRDAKSGSRTRLRADGIVHAAGGTTTPLDRLVGNESTTGQFRTATRAIWTHVDELPRFEEHLRESGIDVSSHPFRCDDAALHHLLHEGWIWQIRFWNGRTSVGLVAPRTPGQVAMPPHAWWVQVIERYPSLVQLYRAARLATQPGRWYGADRLQWRRRFAATGGAVWLPSAFGFVDPLHSTGIAATLWGIDRIAAYLEDGAGGGPLFDGAWASAYDRHVRRDTSHVDRLIHAAYIAMHHADLFHAATMLYFAAATSAERWSVDSNGRQACGFLGSNNPAFVGALDASLAVLQNTPSGVSRRRIEEAIEAIETILKPFNEVGLFRPIVPRMYMETAAPDG